MLMVDGGVRAGLGDEKLEEMLRLMFRIRRFEEKLAQLFKRGRLPGFVHLYIGEEAIAVGACSALRADDCITSTHRGHGHLIAKGADLNAMMAELFGKVDGLCRGKGGSMHAVDFRLGILGTNGIVGGGIPISVGSAWAATKRAVERGRAGEGPTLIEAISMRWHGHNEGEEAFAGHYRPEDEVASWKLRDPIEKLGTQLKD